MPLRDTDRIDSVLSAGVADGSVIGVVAAAADRDGASYFGARGRADAGSDAPMRTDALFRVASMTKAVTSVAVMQLVERGQLALDDAAELALPELRSVRVLDGFDAAGRARLRPPSSAPTVRQLLSHTSGFGYEMWSEDLVRCQSGAALPSLFQGGAGFLNAPLLFDPGSRWMYGIGTDWLGRIVEQVAGTTLDAYFAREIFEPLGMRDTGFVPAETELGRLAGVSQRMADRALSPRRIPAPVAGGFSSGGGGLISTASDYLTFLRALLGGGALAQARILKAESVAAMASDQLGALEVEPLATTDPATSADVEFFPGVAKRWGLGFLINAQSVAGGRAAGSYGWAGLFNCYYWVDPASGICALLLTQVLPFFDPDIVLLLDRFERAVYAD